MIYKELEILQRVSHTVLNNQEVHSLLNEILDILDKDVKASRVALTLFNDGFLNIVASKGLTSSEIKRGQYKLGEGITGEVAKNKTSILIPDISRDKRFLNRTESRKNSSTAFICSPIIKNKDLIGTISIDLDNREKAYIEKYHQVIDIIANLIADAVSVIRDESREKEALKDENRRLIKELTENFQPENIVGSSSGIQKACRDLLKVANEDKSILICGEEGTGKKLFAKTIHYNSNRRNLSFISFNCSLIPESLVENDFFGVVQDGNEREGYIHQAQGGTLFIEEICDLPIKILEKINLLLSNRTFMKVNGSKMETSDVRIIVATSYDLNSLKQQNLFPKDLYSRLSVSSVMIPKLNQRKTDITLLAEFFLKKLNKEHGNKIKRISTPAIDMLLSYHWPGNVRELYSCIEQAFLDSSNDVINGYDLSASLQTALPKVSMEECDLVTAINNYEREFIIEALKKNRGNAAATARSLKTTPRVLNYKFNKLNINLKNFKQKR